MILAVVRHMKQMMKSLTALTMKYILKIPTSQIQAPKKEMFEN